MSGSKRNAGHVRTDTPNSATALLGSPSGKESGFKSYAAVGSARYDVDQQIRKKRNSVHHVNDAPSDDDDDEGPTDEQTNLLAHDITTLNHSNAAAATSRDAQGDDGEPPPPPPPPTPQQPVKWRDLPRKSQLAILTLSRLSEPLTQTSLQSYMFYQLKSFTDSNGQTPSDSTVARQAGLLAAAFTGAQFCTAMMWGRLADSERFGRKRVILIGLLGTAIGSLGFGFSQSFGMAMFWRAMGGVLNGNMGVMRTMISEIVKEKKYQSRAFLLLPMTFNIGVIVGPLLGGLLADPAGSYPGLFGPGGSVFGGEKGVWLFVNFPYALPNIVNAGFLTMSATAVILGLEETLEGLRGRSDWGLKLGTSVARVVFRRRAATQEYVAVAGEEIVRDVELNASAVNDKPKMRRKLPFRQIWTRNVCLTFLAHGIMAMHIGTFNNLWFVFLSTPRYDPAATGSDSLPLPEGYRQHPPFTFTGGLALPPPAIGTALAILGVIGISLQLLLFPRLSFRLGTITSYRLSLTLFPISYTLTPFLAIIPSTLPPPYQASGILIWIAITIVLIIQVMGRTFALPSTAILVNNCCPHPSVLGSCHGIAQSVSSAARTVGPVLAGYLYGVGLNGGFVGLAWWCMAGVAVFGAIAGRWVKEGDGHEIWLDGEKEELEAEERGKARLCEVDDR